MKLTFNLRFISRVWYSSIEFAEASTLSKKYEALIQQRSSEAERTAFVVHPSSSKRLCEYADSFGKISKIYTFKRLEKHYALVEFQNIAGLDKFISSAKHFPNENRIPYSFGKCLYFHTPASFNRKTKYGSKPLLIDEKNRVFNDGELQNCTSIDAQMEKLSGFFSMSELDVRLKFYIASEIERVAKCIFPESKICLFGSSVNGLGRFNGDMDMSLNIEKNNNNQYGSLHNHPLYYISRIRNEDSRQFSKHILDIIGGMLMHISPQVMNVRRILRARVPIVKFVHSPTEIEGDLCLNNEKAVEMSLIIFKLIHIYPHFATLIFTLRQWARCNNVISPHPGPWLTNFMISMLVLFRFQNMNPSILPPLNQLGSTEKPLKFVEKKVPSRRLSLEELLLDFFNFYAVFNFEENGISLLHGGYVAKPDPLSAIYIENPLEQELNICKNVDAKHRDIFKDACAVSIEKLKPKSATSEKFGILNILSLTDPDTDLLKDSCEYYIDLEENSKEAKIL